MSNKTIFRCLQRSTNRNSQRRLSNATNPDGKTLFTTVIGLEVHAQLQGPNSKLFSRSPGPIAARTLLPNSAVDPFDAALPGTYPMLNQAAVEHAIRAAIALGSQVEPVSVFERKHYYYYDLPTGFQITQQRHPLATGGSLPIPELGGNTYQSSTKKKKLNQHRVMRLNRIQLEQDSGKTLLEKDKCLVDLNRAGASLVEFVFEPDLRSAEEAGSVVRNLINLLRHVEVCDGSMEQGALRVDLNISLVPTDYVEEAGLTQEAKMERLYSGNRVEVKNMNSVKNIIFAAQYEIERQRTVLLRGERVLPETRGFDNKKRITFYQRSKEDAYDYRFFPDPDLLPLLIKPEDVTRLAATLPELPEELFQRFISQYSLSEYEASILVNEPASGLFFEKVLNSGSGEEVSPKLVATWIINNIFGALAMREISQSDFFTDAASENSYVSPQNFKQLLELVSRGIINQSTAKKVFDVLIANTNLGTDSHASSTNIFLTPIDIVDKYNWRQITDKDELAIIAKSAVTDEKLASDLAVWKELKMKENSTEGKLTAQKRLKKIEKFFIGAAMRACGGKASPELLAMAVTHALLGDL